MLYTALNIPDLAAGNAAFALVAVVSLLCVSLLALVCEVSPASVPPIKYACVASPPDASCALAAVRFAEVVADVVSVENVALSAVTTGPVVPPTLNPFVSVPYQVTGAVTGAAGFTLLKEMPSLVPRRGYLVERSIYYVFSLPYITTLILAVCDAFIVIFSL